MKRHLTTTCYKTNKATRTVTFKTTKPVFLEDRICHAPLNHAKYFSLFPITLNNLLQRNSFKFIINVTNNRQLHKPSRVPQNTRVKLSPYSILSRAHIPINFQKTFDGERNFNSYSCNTVPLYGPS